VSEPRTEAGRPLLGLARPWPGLDPDEWTAIKNGNADLRAALDAWLAEAEEAAK